MADLDDNAFYEIAKLCLARGIKNIKAMPGLCHIVVDDTWQCWINGHSEPLTNDCGAKVEPFHAYVEFNGWPAGFMNARHATFVAGAAGNIENFIEAVRAAQREAERVERGDG